MRDSDSPVQLVVGQGCAIAPEVGAGTTPVHCPVGNTVMPRLREPDAPLSWREVILAMIGGCLLFPVLMVLWVFRWTSEGDTVTEAFGAGLLPLLAVTFFCEVVIFVMGWWYVRTRRDI